MTVCLSSDTIGAVLVWFVVVNMFVMRAGQNLERRRQRRRTRTALHLAPPPKERQRP